MGTFIGEKTESSNGEDGTKDELSKSSREGGTNGQQDNLSLTSSSGERRFERFGLL